MEQAPINAEVGKSLGLKIEEIDAVKNPQYIKEYQLTATPTTLAGYGITDGASTSALAASSGSSLVGYTRTGTGASTTASR